jgi:hypothetical protein
VALTGYIANVLNLPPLVFRFQINPTVLMEKKTYEYEEITKIGKGGFDKTKEGLSKSGFSAVTGFIGGVVEDIKEWGPLLTDTPPLQPKTRGGKPRVFELEFTLDAGWRQPDGSMRWDEATIEYDLQILRSFVQPSFGLFDLGDVFSGKLEETWKPPEVSLKYGGISCTGVMTDLNIKITAFYDDGRPLRADVTTVIKEQVHSISAVTGFAGRLLDTTKAAFQTPIADIGAASPIGFLFD